MKQLAVFSLLFLSNLAFAQPRTDISDCLKDMGPSRRIVRDSAGRVACINYGGTKAVEYIYNNTKENQEIDQKTYIPDSLVGKKFQGFNYIHHIPEQPIFTPEKDLFYTGVLKELLMEVTQLKSLPLIIADIFPDTEKQKKFIDDQIKNYFTSNNLNLVDDFDTKNIFEKLKYFQRNIIQNFDESGENYTELSDENEKKIRQNLEKKFNNKLSIAKCNPMITNWIFATLDQKMIVQKDTKLPLLAHTSFASKGLKIFMGNLMLDKLFDKTIQQVKNELSSYTFERPKELLNQRYNRTQTPVLTDYKNVSVLSMTLVHELGHVKQLMILANPKYPYMIEDRLLGAAGFLYDSTTEGVPDDLRKKINDEIIEPFAGIMEFSADSFFTDNMPCLF